MKKLYSLLSACLLFGGATNMSAEREVTTITGLGTKVTNVSQLSAGAKVLFKAQSRDGYLFEDSNKLYLGRTVTSSASSAFYVFTVETYTNNGAEASITLKTPNGFNFPALEKGRQSTVDAETQAASFTISPAGGETDGDSIYYIRDESSGIMFNGNEIVFNSTTFGAYGTFVGWDAPGQNSRYMIYLPETAQKTLYTISVSGVNTAGDDLFGGQNKTYELGMGDSLRLPVVDGYRIDFANSTVGANPLTEADFFKVTGDAEISLTYVRNATKFQVIEEGKDTTWYFLKIRGNRFCFYDPANNTDGVPTAAAAKTEADSVAPYLWAFTGSYENGFTVINKLAGNSSRLTATGNTDGSPVVLTPIAESDPAAYTFKYVQKGQGFVLGLPDTENAFINHYGGEASSKLKFWVNANSINNNGSRFSVVKYDRDSLDRLERNNTLNKFEKVAFAEGYVGGFTAEETKPLKDAIAAAREALKTNATADTTAARAAYDALLTKTPIAFDASKTYAIISSYRRAGDLADRKFALSYGDSIATGDSIRRVTWAELPANIKDGKAPAGFKWKFVDPQNDYNANAYEGSKIYAEDSIKTVYAIENQLLSLTHTPGAETKLYVGDFKFQHKVTMVPKEKAFKMYLQPGKFKGMFSILSFRSNGTNESGVTTYTRVGISLEGLGGKALKGITGSNNTIAAIDYNGFYLLEVADVADHDTAVGISSVEVRKALKNGAIFDLTGRKVNKAQKGVFIINGKKAVVR